MMDNTKRNMPADFAERAAEMGFKALIHHYACGDKAVKRWIRESGVTPLRSDKPLFIAKPVPDDFAEAAKTLGVKGLCARYQSHRTTILRWAKEANVTLIKISGSVARAIPVPDDFAERAKEMNVVMLKRHYNVVSYTVYRWIKETGVQPVKGRINAAAVRRPDIPEDFATMIRTKTRGELAEMYGRTPETISRWAKMLNLPFYVRFNGPDGIPIPDDFREIGVRMTYDQAKAHYGVSSHVIESWRKRLGVKVEYRRAAPEDFKQMAPTLNQTQLMKLYGVTGETVKRWCSEEGVNYYRNPDRQKQMVDRRHVLGKRTVPMLSAGIIDRAAHHLRQFYRNVFRADILVRESTKETWGDRHGVPNRGKGYYVIDNMGFVPANDVLEMAVKKGFRV